MNKQEEFKKYISDNKNNIDETKIPELMNNTSTAFKEWQDTWSISNNYFKNTPTQTQETTTQINTAQEAQQNVVEQVKSNITEEQKAIEERKKQLEERAKEDERIKNEQLKQTELNAAKEAEITRRADEKIAEQEKIMQEQLNERIRRETEDRTALLNKQRAEQDAAAELQKFKDEEAQRKLKEEVEVNKMRSNWAFNKMWIAFSSAAISTASSIAIQWASAIAQLKTQSNYNQANIANKAADLEFNFSRDINSTIDKYTDAWINLRMQTIKRIEETSNSLLKTEAEKEAEKTRIKENFIINKKKNEDALYAEMSEYRQRALQQAKILEQELLTNENKNKERINTFISTWGWNTMTASQKQKYANQSWMTVQEIEDTKRKAIYWWAMELIASSLWNDYIPSVMETDEIISEANRLLDAWRPLEEAIRIVTNRVIKRNPLYKQTQELKKWTIAKQLKSLYSSPSVPWYNPKASDIVMIYNDDWTVMAYNKILNKGNILTQTAVKDMEVWKAYTVEEWVRLMMQWKSEDEIQAELNRINLTWTWDLKSWILEEREVEVPIVTNRKKEWSDLDFSLIKE